MPDSKWKPACEHTTEAGRALQCPTSAIMLVPDPCDVWCPWSKSRKQGYGLINDATRMVSRDEYNFCKSIESLGKSGLDYLNISVDGFEPDTVSSKNSVIRKNLVDSLKKARKKYRMHFRINSVIYNNNFETLKKRIAFSGDNNVQISLGFVVPPVDGYARSEGSIYFENIFRFLEREKFWDCNYPTRYGWVNVTPNGKIRTCTKKMDELNIDFEDLDIYKLKDLRAVLKEKVQKCNLDCYSNCAYDSYFYTHHKLQMLKKITSRFTHQKSSRPDTLL